MDLDDEKALLALSSIILASGLITGYVLGGPVGAGAVVVLYGLIAMLLVGAVDREPAYGPHQ